MTALTRKQARQVDRDAIEHLGVPGIVLMENAGRNAASLILDLLAQRSPAASDGRVVIVCGGGNNGGDGYVIARHLHNAGVDICLAAATPPAKITGDAAINHRICANLGLAIEPVLDQDTLDRQAKAWSKCDLVVDALLGTGFEGQVRPHMAAIINRINRLDGPMVVAIDVPSGLDCDTGQPSNATVRADVTITFVAAKIGFEQPAAAAWLGKVHVADIGIPAPR